MKSLVLLAAVLCLGCESPLMAVSHADPVPYPRFTGYQGGSSGGAPFVKADGTLDMNLIQLTSRYPMVTLNPNACLLRPDLIAAFRRCNPAIRIILYHQHSNWHLDSTAVLQTGDQTFYAEQQRALNWAHGWTGQPSYGGFPIDWKQRDAADTLIRLWVKVTKQLRPDGWFFDYFSPSVYNMLGITEDDASNRLYNTRRMVDALRAAQPGILLFGNGAVYGAGRCGLDGQMNEGFEGTLTPFATAIKQNEGDWLKSESPVGSSGNASLARYTLGVACLTGAYANHGNSHFYGTPPEDGAWWFPEYAVDPNGNPDPTGRYVGWMGQPAGATTKLTTTLWRRHFDGPLIDGCVVVNSGTSAATAPLGGTYRLIGSQTNITSVTVGAGTAVFLWKP